MKSDLIWGWIFVGLALVMVACIVYGCFIGNWAAVPMCSFALSLNVLNAISRFKSYRARKRFNDAFKTPRSSAGMMSGGSFIDD